MTSKPGVLLDSQCPPTLLHLPADVRSSAGAECAELAETAGLILDDWQRDVLDGALSERKDGRWSAFEVAEVVPRQNGKNGVIEARQLGGLFLFGERLQVHSAHEFKTALEHFLRIKGLIEETPDFDSRVKIIRTGSADMSIELLSGQRLRFVARSKSSGRGLSGDTVYLDEAFALQPAQLGALVPTMRARPNPQLWYASSAPKHDSHFLHALLGRAGDPKERRLFLAAWENPPETDDNDRESWWRVNPAMGLRITEESMENELALLGVSDEGMAEFRRECLGVRELPLAHGTRLEVPAATWLRACDPSSVSKGSVAVGVDVDADASGASIGVAGHRSDGAGHVEVIESKPGTDWVLGVLAGVLDRSKPLTVAVDAAGPVQQLLPEVRQLCKEHRVKLIELTGRSYAAACGELVEAVKGRRCWHRGQGWLDDAVASGRRRTYGDQWIWDRRVGANVSPLIAVTVARRALIEAGNQQDAEPMFAYS